MPKKRGMTHGLASTYTVGACRCDLCRRANTLKARDYRARRKIRDALQSTQRVL